MTILESILDEYEDTINDFQEDAFAQYAWEQDMERTWEHSVDTNGKLKFTQPIKTRKNIYRIINRDTVIIKRGIIRNILILFDLSDRMRDIDFKPNRLHTAVSHTSKFIKDLFYQCPISQVGIVAMKNKIAKLISPFGSNVDEQLNRLNDLLLDGPEGDTSLQNALEMSISILNDVPQYTTREVLIVFGSIKTCDPGNIFATIKRLQQHHITVDAISLSSELYILKHICNETKGTHSVAIDANNLTSLFTMYTNPPIWQDGMLPMLVKVGFPTMVKSNTASLCVCHGKLVFASYTCPQCSSITCHIPSRCRCCQIYLIPPADVCRGFHHLSPPEEYINISNDNINEICSSCSNEYKIGMYNIDDGFKRCPGCLKIFCGICDEFIHGALHQCPFCINMIKPLNN